MIGTPCYDGRLDVWYTNSLINTVKKSADNGVEIIPMWVSFDALIQRARNDTIQLAIEAGVDDLVWIDSDIEWQPEWFYRLLQYPQDVVGGTYPKKSDKEEYVVRKLTNNGLDKQTGLYEVHGLGTGFVKMSRKAIQYLWDNSPPYIDPKDDKERRMVFNVALTNNPASGLMSEDIYAFETLMRGGFKIHLDPTICCNHIGPKKFTGNYQNWYNKIANKTKQL